MWSTKRGGALRQARDSRGLTQGEVAGRVGCTSSRVSELERNRESGGRTASPSVALVSKLERLFPELRESRARGIRASETRRRPRGSGSPVPQEPRGSSGVPRSRGMNPHANHKLDPQQVELVGRAGLETALVQRNFEVARPERDKGIDLLVYQAEPGQTFRALPIQVKALTNEGFALNKKYDRIPGLILAYIWGAGTVRQRFFLMTYLEAVELLGNRAKSRSWEKEGKYNVSSPGRELTALMEAYEDRFEWLRTRLAEATTESRAI